MKEVSYLLALAFWFTFASMLFCSSLSDSQDSDDSDDCRYYFENEADALETSENESVDITSLEWISQVPELANLHGIQVRNGPAGFEIVTKLCCKA